MRFLENIDPRLKDELLAAYERRRGEFVDPLPRGATVVLAGHRAAGKSTLLRKVGEALGRACVDLDGELERRAGRFLREWVQSDERGFRAAEREAFSALPPGRVVAVGGGFLASHREALVGCVTVLVPVSFETYRERLLADRTRPRLRPELSLEEELREIYAEREELHRAARPLSLVDFVLRLERGLRPRRVVTLPPGVDPHAFAWRARHQGADLLEIRSDLLPHELELKPASRALPLLVSQRTAKLPDAWLALAALVDRPLEVRADASGPSAISSLHADVPLSPDEAVGRWEGVSAGVLIKHVEPLGDPGAAARLFETRARLVQRFGEGNVTVLPTGPLALPFRAVLARANALDYLALDATFQAAPGQRLLSDVVREWRRPTADGETERLGILGHGLAHSRSPRVHPQPFDRIDLPEDVDLAPLLDALRPHYRAFAVTSPFKQRAATASRAGVGAVNTLVRTPEGYVGASTDDVGAGAVLDALGAKAVTVLGDGGVGPALRAAASSRNVALTFLEASRVTSAPVTGAVVWTWPPSFPPPAALRFEDATVAVISYGAPGRVIAREVAERGGVPKRLGARWFIAQARAQRAHFLSSPPPERGEGTVVPDRGRGSA
ncbi:MAG: shikimate kinase [Myxococcota bacterium]